MGLVGGRVGLLDQRGVGLAVLVEERLEQRRDGDVDLVAPPGQHRPTVAPDIRAGGFGDAHDPTSLSRGEGHFRFFDLCWRGRGAITGPEGAGAGDGRRRRRARRRSTMLPDPGAGFALGRGRQPVGRPAPLLRSASARYRGSRSFHGSSGVATKIDEYAPMSRPMNSARPKSRNARAPSRPDAHDEQRRDRQQRDERGVQRPHQHLVQRAVRHRRVRQALDRRRAGACSP